MILPGQEGALRAAIRHFEAAYPNEGCGLILERGPVCWFRPMRNVVDRFHRADPLAFPQDARSAYLFEPREQREVWALARREGWRIAAIAHSHCDQDAGFSDLDRAMATTPAGAPLHPGVDYLVVSLARGRFAEARVHAFAAGGWTERPLSLDGIAARNGSTK